MSDLVATPFSPLDIQNSGSYSIQGNVADLRSGQGMTPYKLSDSFDQLNQYCDMLADQLNLIRGYLSSLSLLPGPGISISGAGTEITLSGSADTKEGVCSAGLTLTNAFQDITGATLTADRDGYWMIVANVSWSSYSADGTLRCQLLVNGSVQTGVLWCNISAGVTVMTGMCSRTWILPVSSGQIVKLQAKKDSGAATSVVYDANTNLVAMWLRSLT